MTIRIRPGLASDADAVATLHTASWRTAYVGIMPGAYLDGALAADHKAMWLSRLTAEVAPGSLFVAESGSELLGFIYLALQPDGRVLIDNLHVGPALKRGGIGTRLLRHGFEWAAAEFPGHPVYLEVLEDNTAAIAFYERHGGRAGMPRTYRFPQGFEVQDLEITWPVTPAG
ncbi:N-acetyltransferase family protein [Nocardia sp. CA-136227]|uniref:GNAT family N-acetyltransferase n=1 Tax=Nocardia sp. CA-136227 TaxID=3239979 RepID=UPI003D955E9E